MKTLILLLSILQLSILQSYGKRIKDCEYCWLNIRYIECLENRLPCECERLTETYYSIVLDTNSISKNYGVALSKFDQMEPHIYPIKRIGYKEYIILKNLKDRTSWGSLIIKEDSLYLTENNILSKFYKSEKVNIYNRQHYMVDNIHYLNKSFTKRGYPKLEEIVQRDSLLCDCNKWMGNVNILFVKGVSQSWIIEQTQDSIHFSEIVNIERDPDDPVLTKKIFSYRWSVQDEK